MGTSFLVGRGFHAEHKRPSIRSWTNGGRVHYWSNLIRRWAGLEADSIKERLPPISYLQCYSHNSKTGRKEKVDRNVKRPDHMNFINLDEFGEYLKDAEYKYQLQIPLPQCLYPNDTIVVDEGDKQLSDSAKAKRQLSLYVKKV